MQRWEALFKRALTLIDSVGKTAAPLNNWSFGGGTVLMRRHHHRFSKDIDIFFPDPQPLGYLNPKLNDTADELANSHLEDPQWLKLLFDEGEIDFVASAPLTEHPWETEQIFGREVKVETSTEIIAKKVWHRGALFTRGTFSTWPWWQSWKQMRWGRSSPFLTTSAR
jgi:hypothetical protein